MNKYSMTLVSASVGQSKTSTFLMSPRISHLEQVLLIQAVPCHGLEVLLDVLPLLEDHLSPAWSRYRERIRVTLNGIEDILRK